MDDITLAPGHGYRRDFRVECAILLRRLGPAHTFCGETVLLLAGEVVPVGAHLAEQTHRLLLVRVGQAIPRHVIDELGAAIADADTRALEPVRGMGHRFPDRTGVWWGRGGS